MTKTASNMAFELGMVLQDVVDLVQRAGRGSFFKSMTSEASSAIWQDVYHLPWQGLVLYVKFTTDPNGYLLISLKEK